jgi:xanthine dehydrogenase YagR molybdenum-binding subunit
MRAPGEASGTFAIESALDELAYKLQIDPIELRLINYAETDPQKGKPWSLKNLKDCYRRGADAIGWSNRAARPAALREGDYLVGYGMATAIYPANRVPASAKVRIFSDGHAAASSATQDIGTGTYTIMTQIAAETLGLPVEKVEFKLGDSALPKAPVSGGSQTAASVGPAVKEAALFARNKLLQLAISDTKSPLFGQALEYIIVENGRCFIKDNPSSGETYSDILNRSRLDFMEGEAATKGSTREGGDKKKKPKPSDEKENIDLKLDAAPYSFQSFGAQFARVLFDPLLGVVRVSHCAAVMDIGKVLNLKTARNQIMGGMIFGIGMALMEETIYDSNRGRIVTRDLANYLVPVHADIPEIEVQFIDQPDPHITSMGARGIGEIGITGITAAIANAIYNASGKRIRDLPITPDKLL